MNCVPRLVAARKSLLRQLDFPLLAVVLLSSHLVAADALVVSETTLANGLRVAVYENHSSPVVAIQIWYRVGSYYEHSGYTGLSHLLEHMMFKGTREYGPGRYDALIEERGGDENAFTSEHYTVYWAELDTSGYELALRLEADRMQNLLLDSMEFEKERNVVMEERRLGENSPYDAMWESFFATAYVIHPYRNPVIGWMDDLGRLQRSHLVQHYRTYYTPANACIVVAGDVNPHRVFAQVVKYFGRIKSHPVPDWQPVEPPQVGERTVTVRRDVMTPAMMVGWHVPGTDNPSFYALEVIDGLLLRGRTARLFEHLVYRDGLLLEISGGNDVEKYPGMFYIFAIPRSVPALDSAERILEAELESLKVRPVSDSELARVKNVVVADFIFRQERNRGIGYQIGRAFTMYNGVDFLNQYPARIAQVSKEEIMQAARKYFTCDNRTRARLLPLDAISPTREER